VGEACTCHQQILPFDWRVPTAAAEVPLAPAQALQQILHHGVAMHILPSTNRLICTYLNRVLLKNWHHSHAVLKHLTLTFQSHDHHIPVLTAV